MHTYTVVYQNYTTCFVWPDFISWLFMTSFLIKISSRVTGKLNPSVWIAEVVVDAVIAGLVLALVEEFAEIVVVAVALIGGWWRCSWSSQYRLRNKMLQLVLFLMIHYKCVDCK